MEFKIGDFVTIVLPPLHITIPSIIIIICLIRWSKQLETRRFTVFFYFLVSTFIVPLLYINIKEVFFELWVPLGFIVVLLYMFRMKRYHPAKMKASILGFCIVIYQLILQYVW